MQLELEKTEAAWDLARLIKDEAITIEDLSDFSEDMQEWVLHLIGRRTDDSEGR